MSYENWYDSSCYLFIYFCWKWIQDLVGWIEPNTGNFLKGGRKFSITYVTKYLDQELGIRNFGRNFVLSLYHNCFLIFCILLYFWFYIHFIFIFFFYCDGLIYTNILPIRRLYINVCIFLHICKCRIQRYYYCVICMWLVRILCVVWNGCVKVETMQRAACNFILRRLCWANCIEWNKDSGLIDLFNVWE